MANWDDVSAPAPQTQGNSWDAVSTPVAPKLPDTSGVSEMATKNLSSTSEGDGSQQPQTPEQRLNQAAGIPVTSALSGSKDVPPLSADMRGHLVDSYKNGTADNAADFMQSALPAIAATTNPAMHYAQLAGNTALQTATWLHPVTIAAHLFDIPLNVGAMGAQVIMEHVPEDSIFHANPQDYTQNKPPTFGGLFEAIGKKIFPEGQPQNSTENLISSASTFAGAGALAKAPTLAMKAWNAFTGAAVGAGGTFSQEKAAQWAKQNFPDSPVIQDAISQAAGLVAMIGTGGVLHTVGHEALKPIVAQTLNKAPQDVSTDDINQTIAAAYHNKAPAAQDFHDVGVAINQNISDTGNYYHGTPNVEFKEFADTGGGRRDQGAGFYFIPHKDIASFYSGGDNGRIIATNLDIKNPLKVGNVDELTDFFKSKGETLHRDEVQGMPISDMNHILNKYGYDSIQYPSGLTIVTDPAKIKIMDNGLGNTERHSQIVDTLHQTYKETGVHPDQVYEDAKNNPEVAADLAAGKVPAAYDHLRGPTPEPETPKPSTEGATESINPLAKIFNPAGMSDSARDMATALRQSKGPIAQDVAQIQDGLQKYNSAFRDSSDEDNRKMIAYMEGRSSGAVNPFPELQDAADKLKSIYDQMYEQVKKTIPDTGFIKDYIARQYEHDDASKKFFSDWVAKQGSERNIKERIIPTLEEAIEAGLKPKSLNPIETTMQYVTNMGNLLSAHRAVELAKEYGVVDYFKKGQQPSGWVPLNGNLAEDGGKTLFAPEDAARVYNNDISEKFTGPVGDILDNVQRMNNFSSKLVLGLSGYHFTATTMASMASDVGRALTEGSLAERAQNVGSAITPFAHSGIPFLTKGKGGELIDAYLGRSELQPELQKALDLAVKNNTINIKQQDYWKAGPAKDYVDAFKSGTLGTGFKDTIEGIKSANPSDNISKAVGALKQGKMVDAALHAVGAIGNNPVGKTVGAIAGELGRTMDTISKPLFDEYIPKIKISANISELHAWLQEHPDATPAEQDKAAQDIGNSIDNRFGEMMRDNLFWHQMTRQTMQTTFLSYSWITGSARLLKGIPDTASAIMNKGELSSNAKYMFGMAATYAIANGVSTYLHTGQVPSDWKDFIYPKTGGETPQHKPERELLPSHIGQYTNYIHEGLGAMGNELNPGLQLLLHLTANKDWRGLPITNDNNSWFSEQKWSDYAKYVLHEVTPIQLQNFLQGHKKGSDISATEQAFGIRQAPRYITDPEGYDKMMEGVNNREYKKKVRSDNKIAGQYESNDNPDN